ncbi:hypothetical protein GRB98_003786 [Escherichia coli]|nr:hypothetical protein [Escherichia coli]
MRENPGLAATVPVAPPLSRRGLRSWHPGKRPPGCKAQRRFAHALFVVAAGPCPLLCPVPFTCLSPRTVVSGRGSDAPCGEGSQTGDG